MKKILGTLFVLLPLAGIFAFWTYNSLFGNNVKALEEQEFLFLDESPTLETFSDKIAPFVSDTNIKLLPSLFKAMKIKSGTLKPGRYQWNHAISLVDLLRKVRIGDQAPIDLVLFKLKNKDELSTYLSETLQKDKTHYLTGLTKFINNNSLGYTDENFLTLIVPNTYQFFWTCDVDCFLNRMEKENAKYWTETKIKKLENLGLDTKKAYTLASIVEMESLDVSEKPRISGVYLNRLKKGILLQADPTVVFASGEQGLRRVLNKHLAIDSPYNTYMYPGLPPGPITMPSLSSLESVVDSEDHDYIYFCAKPGYEGSHNFSKTLSQHNRYANVYRKWLNSEGIR